VPIRVAEVVIHRAGSQDQVVIGHPAVPGMHVLRAQVCLIHLGEHDRGIGLVPENGSHWLCNIRGRQCSGGNLVQQRLEEVVVVVVDHQDVSRHLPQSPGREQPAEAATDNHYPRTPLSLHVPLRQLWY
jgi:hypothetical protein